MKKLLVSFLVVLSIFSFSGIIFASITGDICVSCSIEEDNTIDGYLNEALEAKMYIEISDAYFDTDGFESDYLDCEVNEWFRDLPEGLIAELTNIEEHSMEITISGTPNELSDNLIEVSIPSLYILNSDDNLPISDDPDDYSIVTNNCLSFNITNPYITCVPVTIKGKKNSEVNETVEISIMEDSINYFTNINNIEETLGSFIIKGVSLNNLKNVLTLSITGTITENNQYNIEIGEDNNEYGVSLKSNTACIISEVEQDSIPATPITPAKPIVPKKPKVEKPKETKKYHLVSTGIE